mmetsp:Transcript_41880/g.66528  ORF Transcript_41880/g.66528 Transcript_41880/m.66528 type:complete len:269 (-) Transcript_41880:558-1364(-)
MRSIFRHPIHSHQVDEIWYVWLHTKLLYLVPNEWSQNFDGGIHDSKTTGHCIEVVGAADRSRVRGEAYLCSHSCSPIKGKVVVFENTGHFTVVVPCGMTHEQVLIVLGHPDQRRAMACFSNPPFPMCVIQFGSVDWSHVERCLLRVSIASEATSLEEAELLHRNSCSAVLRSFRSVSLHHGRKFSTHIQYENVFQGQLRSAEMICCIVVSICNTPKLKKTVACMLPIWLIRLLCHDMRNKLRLHLHEAQLICEQCLQVLHGVFGQLAS